jgi:hypothetical protein
MEKEVQLHRSLSKNRPKFVNNRPLGVKSPNLVTLPGSVIVCKRLRHNYPSLPLGHVSVCMYTVRDNRYSIEKNLDGPHSVLVYSCYDKVRIWF